MRELRPFFFVIWHESARAPLFTHDFYCMGHSNRMWNLLLNNKARNALPQNDYCILLLLVSVSINDKAKI